MENDQKKRILVIEDETHIAEGIRLNLSMKGYDVTLASDGIEGIDAWRSRNPHLIVLDIMLPMMDGLSVLRTIRREDPRLPVLILSAKSSAEDKVKGLRCGVDDYLAKPFDLDEFLLRIERLLERQSWALSEKEVPDSEQTDVFSGDTYCFGDNVVDFVTAKARCVDGEIVLTEQEIMLLRVLIANRGRPVPREKLLKAGWGYSSTTTTRTVDNFMVRLRKYFEKNPKKPVFFKSRRSVGYIFEG
ncbi:DNA-binding response regulator, OmpR family, contains REC and winged-helix (wHTH) domain [Desulfocicer vacuolatum DSM 3385]|uniref:DNA-binding response regulator, OmpR family, contains REC and winged-helix (WHTH) domain n=1 Tax=Desulfocicer vacuolatum DSM 3385 TaxID=1121400 RepID=A0A1W2B7C0_9BACT|nr:response regulator transcription factor [Desulfocicer vacuolatum]SMC68744.1 DNA-binding response regulator, OmpR family, contains REC and winged-helix (wHTH) domain [Desulfocicer vacuolatum DSM 3385]